MIVANLQVHGYGNQVNWSDWRFVQLPAAGDVIGVADHAGSWHYVTVRHTEHQPAAVHRPSDEPSAIVVTDWKESFPPDPT